MPFDEQARQARPRRPEGQTFLVIGAINLPANFKDTDRPFHIGAVMGKADDEIVEKHAAGFIEMLIHPIMAEKPFESGAFVEAILSMEAITNERRIQNDTAAQKIDGMGEKIIRCNT